MVINVFLTCAMVAVPAATTNRWAVGSAALISGMGASLWTVNSRTIQQTLVPSDMMGRFGAAFRLFALGAIPVGAGLSGVLAEWFSATVALAVFAVGPLIVFVPFIRVFTVGAEVDIDNRIKQS